VGFFGYIPRCLNHAVLTVLSLVNFCVVCVFVWQLKVREVLDKYDEVIHGDKKESFQLGTFVCLPISQLS